MAHIEIRDDVAHAHAHALAAVASKAWAGASPDSRSDECDEVEGAAQATARHGLCDATITGLAVHVAEEGLPAAVAAADGVPRLLVDGSDDLQLGRTSRRRSRRRTRR